MHRPTRIKMTDVNPHLICVLCGGYYVDATTVIECLHSFCKSCIVRYLETSKYCPICDVQIHKTKPLLCIRSDQTLQEIVYKLVPGMFQNEMKRRREFYAQHPQEAAKRPSKFFAEERGEVESAERYLCTYDENISLSLEYFDRRGSNSSKDVDEKHKEKRYLQCPNGVTVAHLKKFIRAKFGLVSEHKVDIMSLSDYLEDDFTLMDIAYICAWRRKAPLRLFYRIHEMSLVKRQKTSHNETNATLTEPELVKTGSETSAEPSAALAQPKKDEVTTDEKCAEGPADKKAVFSGENAQSVHPKVNGISPEAVDQRMVNGETLKNNVIKTPSQPEAGKEAKSDQTQKSKDLVNGEKVKDKKVNGHVEGKEMAVINRDLVKT